MDTRGPGLNPRRLALVLGLTFAALPAGAQECAPPGTAPQVQGWQPIETAPKDMDILLGAFLDTGFVKGVGHWEVRDELGGGLWSVEEWWGQSPTHWSAIPPVPCR